MLDELVVLVHGYFRSKQDMQFLASGLAQQGYQTTPTTLPTTLKALNDCCKSLHIQIDDASSNHKLVHFVGHSMGGIIIQQYLQEYKINNIGRCVLIATPFQGSKLADISSRLPLIESLFKPLKSLKTHQAQVRFSPPDQHIDVGVIAGCKNNLVAGQLFLSSKSDGRVETESTKLVDMSDYIELPFGHNDIHHKQRTLLQTINFLQCGMFTH